MDLTQDEIISILKILEESNFDELDLKIGDMSLIASKNGPSSSAVKRKLSIIETRTSESTKPAVQELEDQKAKNIAQEVEQEAITSIEEGLIPIKSPMLGIFYRRPEPGTPAYVEVGTLVKENDTICLLEVMKLFTAVKAGVQGKISKICVENGRMVEYGQTLFLVKPEIT